MSSNLNGTHTDGKLRSFEKNRYFHGKLMTARDMQAEQDYHVDRLKATNRYVTGEGIVCGLDVETAKQEGDELTVKLKPGFALDCFGNPIAVKGSGPVVAKDPDTNQPALPSGENPIYLYLRYDECSLETVPKPGAENACKEECTYNRILEVFDVIFEEVTDETDGEDGGPKGYKPVPPIEFPGPDDVSDESGVIAPDDPGLVKMAREYYADNLSECRTCTHPWVFLGTFTGPTGDDTWVRTDTGMTDGSLVYTNDLLYAGIARHSADFRNPHRVTLTVTPLDEVDIPAGADAFLSSRSTYEQGQILFFDGREVVESITGEDFEDTTSEERTFQIREVSEAGEVGSLAAEVRLDDAGHAFIDTENLDGDYVIVYPEEDTFVQVSSTGVGSAATGAEAVENAGFSVAVELPPDESGEAAGVGAKVRIRDDESPGGAVDLDSSDGTVSIGATPRGEETPSEIDLTVSPEQIAAEIDAIRTLVGVGGDDENGNVDLESETIEITPDAANNSIALEVPQIDAIETLEGVGGDEDGNVDLESETITITPEPENNRIILDAPEVPDGIEERLDDLERRVKRLEQYTVRKSIHCKFTSYAVVEEKFEEIDDVTTPVINILDVTEGAIDAGDFSPGAYINFIQEVLPHEEELIEALAEDVVTDRSRERYTRAFRALARIDINEENVSELATAQDCLAKAAEWLQPRREQ